MSNIDKNKDKKKKVLSDEDFDKFNDDLDDGLDDRHKAKDEKFNKKRKKKKHKVLKRILLTILVIILTVVIVFTTLVIKNGGGLTGLVTTVVGSSSEKIKTLPDIYTLCVGVSTGMTDTIMVAKYSPQNQQASLMSIPRDTFVGSSQATAKASNKINALYVNKGPMATVDKVNELTGLNIKYYIVVDTKALRDLVDCIGGVYFDVPIDMDYDDCTQDLAIHVKAGYQLLNGTQAEGVCRFRHNNNGTSYPASYGDNDLGRMRTQREFIKTVIKQTMQAKNIGKIDDILKIAQEEVETNIDWNKSKDYIAALMGFNTENMRSTQLPGATAYINEVSFFLANESMTRQVVQSTFLTVEDHSSDSNLTEEENITDNENVVSNEITNTSSNTTSKSSKKKKLTQSEKYPNLTADNSQSNNLKEAKSALATNPSVKIEIINGSGTTTKLTSVRDQLTNMGYKVKSVTTTNSIDNTVVIARNAEYIENAKSIHALLGAGNIVNGTPNASADITIILGKDY